MEEEEILEKINQFLDKQGLDVSSKYFITKKLNSDYWEEIKGGEEEGIEEDLGEFGEEEPEEIEEEPEDLPPKKPKKAKIKVKTPKLRGLE